MLEKVIQGEEDEVEDAKSYINNLRKRLAGRMKIEKQGRNIEEVNNIRESQMESEESGGAGFSWKKRSLF